MKVLGIVVLIASLALNAFLILDKQSTPQEIVRLPHKSPEGAIAVDPTYFGL